jgi:hypothetical protein
LTAPSRVASQHNKTIVCCYQGVNDRIPLHIILKKHPPFDVVKMMLSKAPEALKINDNHGCLPLHLALSSKTLTDVLQVLIQNYPECLKLKDEHSKLLIHLE